MIEDRQYYIITTDNYVSYSYSQILYSDIYTSLIFASGYYYLSVLLWSLFYTIRIEIRILYVYDVTISNPLCFTIMNYESMKAFIIHLASQPVWDLETGSPGPKLARRSSAKMHPGDSHGMSKLVVFGYKPCLLL